MDCDGTWHNWAHLLWQLRQNIGMHALHHIHYLLHTFAMRLTEGMDSLKGCGSNATLCAPKKLAKMLVQLLLQITIDTNLYLVCVSLFLLSGVKLGNLYFAASCNHSRDGEGWSVIAGTSTDIAIFYANLYLILFTFCFYFASTGHNQHCSQVSISVLLCFIWICALVWPVPWVSMYMWCLEHRRPCLLYLPVYWGLLEHAANVWYVLLNKFKKNLAVWCVSRVLNQWQTPCYYRNIEKPLWYNHSKLP